MVQKVYVIDLSFVRKRGGSKGSPETTYSQRSTP